MNKRERFYAAVAGEKVDRVPICVWMHFATPQLSGEQSAEMHCRFFRHYGWDIGKAVSDYRYPFVDGMEAIETLEDMGRITAQSMSEPTYTEQLNLLKAMRRELGEDWPILDTTFDPIQQVLRHGGFSAMNMIFDNPDKSKPMLEAATETIIRYVQELKKIGVDGVFYSTRAAATEECSEGYTTEQFESFLRPYDIAILDEMKGMVRILHACKSHLDLKRVEDYPYEVLSWADRDSTCPTLADVHAYSDKCLMGGINQCGVIDQNVNEIRKDCNDAIALTGANKFILSPGCTIGSHAPDHVLNALSDFAKLA